ncbi:LysR family transcriptional regulator [Luteibacter sp. UNCMF366Tsu5.1]|uniref:LysR family transcriptional regulator n=1 Tax=Luteibacter sp. UNCMF366Tsu5.1 TaxID=1502758 RepID=UPI000908813D|nr:LysR family transcriptional regulator [Luteibacter sp. UNCMF366Tsu5.1]SFW25326.1 DNA-binding transcriptional regulator, LysR family [Luteibacter sp. UNCMF366Tsu5.1]
MNDARLDWDDLRLFLAIAKTGTLTAAASQLDLSQPTAGRRLRQLEEACGCALFQRSASGFRLTDEGAAMLRHAERMEDEVLAMERELAGQDDTLHGQLRVSSPDWFAHLVLAPAIARFSLRHPRVTIELVADFRMLSLDRREADLVFRFRPSDVPDVVQRRLTYVRYDLFASSGYLAARGRPEATADGEGHAIIGMDTQFDALADVAWLHERFPRAQLTIRSNSREAQGIACAHDAGLAVLPSVLGHHYGLERIDTGDALPSRDLWLCYHADLRRLRRLRTFLDFLGEAIDDPLGSRAP